MQGMVVSNNLMTLVLRNISTKKKNNNLTSCLNPKRKDFGSKIEFETWYIKTNEPLMLLPVQAGLHFGLCESYEYCYLNRYR